MREESTAMSRVIPPEQAHGLHVGMRAEEFSRSWYSLPVARNASE
jgi:hypothetical protein